MSKPSRIWSTEGGALAGKLRQGFDRWGQQPDPWPEERFASLALQAFRVQFLGNEPYRRYCERRGITPESVKDWRRIPPVPTTAFRTVDLVVGDPADTLLTFRTSGTTRGPERRGRHLIRDPVLYRSALEAAFQVFVMQDRSHIQILALLPSFTIEESSSLSWMVDAVMRRFGCPESRRVVTEKGIDWTEAWTVVEEACAAGRPLCALGTTLAFDAWMRELDRLGATALLPTGSRVMDTGGAKGRPGMERASLLDALERRLGIGPAAIFNEFGMTELLSQRYGTPDHLCGPPWLRTRALDPRTLEELPAGEGGILCHFDLANLGSVCAVLTEDRGCMREGALQWLGRTPGAPPRGCSLATADLLESRRRA